MAACSHHLRRRNPRKSAVEEEPKRACFVGVAFEGAGEAKGSWRRRFLERRWGRRGGTEEREDLKRCCHSDQ